MKPYPSILDRLTPRASAPYDELSTKRPSAPVGTGPPDYEGLFTQMHLLSIERPLGRAEEMAEARVLLDQAGSLVVRGLIGGGKTRFSVGVVVSANEGGRYGFITSLRSVRWSSAPTAARAFESHLDAMVELGATQNQSPRDALERAPCTLLVDDLTELDMLPPAERDGVLDALRRLGARPNVQVIANLSETRDADAMEQRLGFKTYVLPALSPGDIWRFFRDAALRFRVVFDSPAVAGLARATVTPQQLVEVMRMAAAMALGQRNASGMVDAALTGIAVGHSAFDPFLDLYPSLAPELLCAMLLQTPYRPETEAEVQHVERWLRYGLVVPLGSGYSLAHTFFSEELAKVIPTKVWRTALRLQDQDPLYARRFLASMLAKVVEKRIGPVF